MLKPGDVYSLTDKTPIPAAFGRLCVETDDKPDKRPDDKPAAFGRLCVETLVINF